MNQRSEMVEEQIIPRGISDKLVIGALEKVHRDMFVPASLKVMGYNDTPLPIGCGQTISQPFIVALMTEMLELKPDYRVLEIGTGSGYQSAVLAEIVDHVYSVEIIPELSNRARETLRNAGYNNISLRISDGSDGWPDYAPYDGIIVTAAAWEIPVDLKYQLKLGRRMVIPVGEENEIQTLWTIIRTGENEFQEIPGISVRFVPMTGKILGDDSLSY